MNRVKFPARRGDGSFCIEIGLSITHSSKENLKSYIQNWISTDWMPRNLTWKRDWRTGENRETIDQQVLNYESEFLGEPKIISAEASELQIRIAGKASAKFWKDWLISKFLPDLKAKFPEVNGQLYIRNCGQ